MSLPCGIFLFPGIKIIEIGFSQKHLPHILKSHLFAKKTLSLHTQWFSVWHPLKEIKRETGENPVQSRCCKLFFS
jgi:hypothetical protein